MRPSTQDADTPEAVLRRPDLYGDLQQPPEVIETHISRLFLTPTNVYKQKKPLSLGFLDFSTSQRRREACEAEVRINRRLAPQIYLGLIGIGRDAKGEWYLGDDHPPESWAAEDWLVHMRRLPEDRCLANLIEAGKCTDQDIQQVITVLVTFYRQLPPVKDDLTDALARRIAENGQALMSPDHQLPLRTVQRVHASQSQFLFIHHDLLVQRSVDGRIVEGHGDLRAEHLYLTDPPVGIDAIEFNLDMRTVDIADELAFFSVSCEMLGAAEIGERVAEGCRAELQDSPPQELLDFYCSYRACVRAKVAAIRALQAIGNREQIAHVEAERYLQIADRHAQRLGPPRAIMIRGASGTGKSTLAREVAAAMSARHLSTDHIRRQFSFPSSDRYSEANRSQVYAALLKEADEFLGEGLSIVIDGTFLQASLQTEFARHASERGADFTVITCQCSEETALERIRGRTGQSDSESEADGEVHREQIRQIEACPGELQGIELDTDAALPRLLTQVATALQKRPLQSLS